MKPAVRRVLTCSLGAVVALTSLSAPAAADDPLWIATSGRFTPPTVFAPSSAVTYDGRRVPAGSGIAVAEFADGDNVVVRLSVAGLRPDRAYGAHVHTRRCGYAPEASGPHYQHRPDPVRPSTDPAYANPDNEVWLDFTTDDEGRAITTAWHDWRFRPGAASSVVLHEHHTATAPGHAGEAGDRLACINVPFA